MECIRSQLLAMGFEEKAFGFPVDLTIINTCTVTAAGDRDGRKMLRKARRVSPHGRIVATGCTAQRDPDSIKALDVVDLILGNREKGNIDWYRDLLVGSQTTGSQTVESHAAGSQAADHSGKGTDVLDTSDASRIGIVVNDDPRPASFLSHAPGFSTARTRAALKIQDGCDAHCTYCIIPSVRGSSISRPWMEVLSEAEGLVSSGAQEIVLTGINTGFYGLDHSPGAETDLASLIRRLTGIHGLERIRLASVEPRQVTPELLELSNHPAGLCPHLHVPLQSGDDEVLKRMGRPYRREEFADLVQRIRTVNPGITIGTDVIVGFPGETEECFQASLDFVKDQAFSYLHVFSYSPRPGTPAERLPGVVPDREKTRRSRLLRDLDLIFRKRHMENRKGSCDRILIERSREGIARGLTGDYLRVVLKNGEFKMGEMCPITIGDPFDDHHVWGIPVDRAPGLQI